VARVWSDPQLLRLGLSFSLPVLIILFVHEMGHYLACRHYRLPSTLPYFLPLPAVLGTLGAFIRIRAPIRDKRVLFDVGAAGPFAGFAALLPFLLYGVARSQPAPLHLAAGASRLLPGQCLAMELATRLFHGHLGDGMVLRLHPFALAAWFGLLATAINLLPLGQLDGGHVLYAVAGRWQRRLALPLWLALAAAGVLWGGWLLWCVVIFAMGLYHPPVVDEAKPLDGRRRALAGAALVVLALCFTPRGAMEPEGDGAAARESDQKSATSVTGPSLTSATSMRARKRPVSTSQPRRRSSSTSAATSGAAVSGGAARSNEGRRPRASEPASVN
jgi:membrane-associated protease RseP (regulator of RpoE activity)